MVDLSLTEIQTKLAPWVKYNFPDQEAWEPLLGVAEEVGELCHAFLKSHRQIRGSHDEHRAAKEDACADIIIFLADYANLEGIDLQHVVNVTLPKVLARDFVGNPDQVGGDE